MIFGLLQGRCEGDASGTWRELDGAVGQHAACRGAPEGFTLTREATPTISNDESHNITRGIDFDDLDPDTWFDADRSEKSQECGLLIGDPRDFDSLTREAR